VAKNFISPSVPSAGIPQLHQQPSVQRPKLSFLHTVLERVNTVCFETPPSIVQELVSAKQKSSRQLHFTISKGLFTFF